MKIIKIGGSILTKKGIWREIDTDTVTRIAEELSIITEPYILMHGLGTLGRSYVPLYQNKIIEYSNMALAKNIQLNVKYFHYEILKLLIRSNIPVRSMDPQSIFVCEHCRIVKAFCEGIDYYLANGCVPVIHGDTVWDESNKYYLLSSDNMLEYLALQLHPDQIIWVTDVDGVYKYVSDNRFQVIHHLQRKNQNEIWNSDYNQNDVTGGMMNKVNISFHLADYGIPSMVINGRVDGNIKRAMSGQAIQATIIN